MALVVFTNNTKSHHKSLAHTPYKSKVFSCSKMAQSSSSRCWKATVAWIAFFLIAAILTSIFSYVFVRTRFNYLWIAVVFYKCSQILVLFLVLLDINLGET